VSVNLHHDHPKFTVITCVNNMIIKMCFNSTTRTPFPHSMSQLVATVTLRQLCTQHDIQCIQWPTCATFHCSSTKYNVSNFVSVGIPYEIGL